MTEMIESPSESVPGREVFLLFFTGCVERHIKRHETKSDCLVFVGHWNGARSDELDGRRPRLCRLVRFRSRACRQCYLMGTSPAFG